MPTRHSYEVRTVWTGNLGEGTSGYRAYRRRNEVSGDGRPVIQGSADRTFRGDADRWDPERLLVASLSQCHMLSYLHQCADAGVVVTACEDHAAGTMITDADGGGRFTEVVLRPAVRVADESMVEPARALHDRAHQLCFIASSVSFPVRHEPTVGLS